MTREELIDELILANDENQILQAELDERDKALNLADVVGQSEQCCSPAEGFYLGVTCPKCNKIFRSVNAE